MSAFKQLPGDVIVAPPELLLGGRVRLVIHREFAGADKLQNGYLPARGSALPGDAQLNGTTQTSYKNLYLVSAEGAMVFTAQGRKHVLALTFETLTGTLVNESAPVVDYDLNGLKRHTYHLIAKTGADVSAYVVGTQEDPNDSTLYLAKVTVVDDGEATCRVEAVYLKPGTIAQSTGPGPGGLPNTIQVTTTTWKAVPTMPGQLLDIRTENTLGFPTQVYTSIALASDSTTPVGKTLATHDDFVPFEYPGVAAAIAFTSDTLDVHLSPPIATHIKAAVAVSLQSSASLPTLSYPVWAPNEWATVVAVWAPTVTQLQERTKGLPGYRALGEFSKNQITSGGVGSEGFIMGEQIYHGATGTLIVRGGPPDPSGQTYLMEPPKLEPVLTCEDGTVLYRLTTVTATVPVQAPPPLSFAALAFVPLAQGNSIAATKATLKAIPTASVIAAGAVTNAFLIQTGLGGSGSPSMAKATLGALSAPLGADTPTLWRPNDYNSSTNNVAWLITTWTT